MKYEPKPKSPNLDDLGDIIEQLEFDIDNAAAVVNNDITIQTKEALFIRDALVFTANSLGSRRVYQKTQQLRRKEETKLLKKLLGSDELRRIADEAKRLAERTAAPEAKVVGSADVDTVNNDNGNGNKQ